LYSLVRCYLSQRHEDRIFNFISFGTQRRWGDFCMTMQLNMYCEHIQCVYCKSFYLVLQFLVLHNRAHRCHITVAAYVLCSSGWGYETNVLFYCSFKRITFRQLVDCELLQLLKVSFMSVQTAGHSRCVHI
jgi:hypothetical protein